MKDDSGDCGYGGGNEEGKTGYGKIKVVEAQDEY